MTSTSTGPRVLATLAELAGHLYRLDALPGGSRPDVLQLRPADGSLFIGDAKATESPGNLETVIRLSGYARSLTLWLAGGLPGVFALIVPAANADGWLGTLRRLPLNVPTGRLEASRVDSVEPGTVVIWQSFAGVRARSTGCSGGGSGDTGPSPRRVSAS